MLFEFGAGTCLRVIPFSEKKKQFNRKNQPLAG